MRTLWLLLLIACTAAAHGGEQYRSRMYIDIEQDATDNVALSVGELEKQLDTLQDSTARASAEKFLAAHYAADKDYPKAIARLEDALQQPGQTREQQRSLLADLARFYLLQQDYAHAAAAINRTLATDPPDAAALYLLLAQTEYRNKRYVDSTAALDQALARDRNPSTDTLQAALAIYYHIGNLERSQDVIKQLVERDINNATLWQQWTSLAIRAGKTADALTVLSLAWEKGLPFREQDVLLLCDLYAINRIPARGARVMEDAMQAGRIATTPATNDRLFRLWLQAGDRDRAAHALEQAALHSDDPELQLHLAQLAMDKEQWPAMQQYVLNACAKPLPDKLVSRANLLLGVSQLKQGDAALARRSFINATLVAGDNDKAGQWLAFMKAEPASDREKAGIAGPCGSEKWRSLWTPSLPPAHAGSPDGSAHNRAR